MSQIVTQFTIYFEDEPSADFFDAGFSLMRDEKYPEAAAHFGKKEIDYWIGEDRAVWWVESYLRDGRLLSADIVSSLSFDEDHFFGEAAKHGATLILANLYNDQVGQHFTFARKDGKKSGANKVFDALAEKNINFSLGIAVDKGKKKEVERLLKEGADPNSLFWGSPLLPWAVQDKRTSIALALLEAGADLNGAMKLTPDNRLKGGQTALHFAVTEKNKRLSTLLLKAGADPNRVDGAGETPLHIAAGRRENYDLAHLLIDHGATLNEPYNERGLTPFLRFLYASFDYQSDEKMAEEERRKLAKKGVKLFDLMLKRGASVTALCAKGGNAYWYANSHREIRQRIASLGVDTLVAPEDAYMDEKTYDNLLTALQHDDVAKFADEMKHIDTLDKKERDKLLYFAVVFFKNDFARSLAEAGADPHSCPLGDIPINQYATRYSNDPALAALLTEKAAVGIARDKERVANGIDLFHRFAAWVATLTTFQDGGEDGASFFTKQYFQGLMANMEEWHFNRMKKMLAETTEVKGGIEGMFDRICVYRAFPSDTIGTHGVVYMAEEEGRPVISKIMYPQWQEGDFPEWAEEE